MSQLIIILGESGGGKSRSIKNLDPDHTVLFNTVGKDLPFPGSRGLYKKGKNLITPNLSVPRQVPDLLMKAMDKVNDLPQVKAFIVDDFQYLMAMEYIQGEKQGEGWEKFTSILIHSSDIFMKAKNLRSDLHVFLMCHTETDTKSAGIGEARTQMKTVGKAFREKMTPEGFATIVLITDPITDSDGNTIYRFRTQTTGLDPVKSPEGMFPRYIPNDLDIVVRRIEEYYNNPDADSPEKSKVLEGIEEEVTQGVETSGGLF